MMDVIEVDGGGDASGQTGGTLPRPGVAEALQWLLVILVWAYVGDLALAGIGPVLSLGDELPWEGAMRVLAVLGALLLAIWPWGMAGARRILAVRGLAFWQVVAICCLAAPLSFTADRVQKVMEWSRPQLRLEAIVRGGAGPDAWKDGLIYSCVLVPAIEEMFFRGYLGRGLVARYGAIVGMILTSLLSGAFSLDLIHAAPLAVRALACHVAYLSSKSIVAPIVLHGLCNGLKFTAYMDATPFLKISALAAFGCLMVLIWQMRTRWVTAGQDWRPSYESAEMPPTALKASARMCRPSWPALVAAIGTALIFAVALGLRMQAMFEELGNVPRAQGEDGRLVCVASGRQGFGCEKSPSSGVPSENL